MPEDTETDQRRVSDSFIPEDELTNAVQEAIDDWVTEDSIPVHRVEGYVVADEEELRKNICVMIAIALGEATD